MQLFAPSSPPSHSSAPRSLQVRDPERCAVSSTYWAVTLLLAALEVGQNIDRLARYTGCKRSFVARCARRLVDNGVWRSGETLCDWAAERERHPSFWKDVAVAEGKLSRRIDEEGGYEWIAAGARIESLDEALSRDDLAPAARYIVPIASPSAAPAEESRRSRRTAGVTRQRTEIVIGTAETGPEPSLPAPLEHPRPAPPQDRIRSLFPDAVWLG